MDGIHRDRRYTTVEVARILGCGRDSVVLLIKEGYIRAHKLKRAYRIQGTELERYMAAAERRAVG